jgi:hypothetical protein
VETPGIEITTLKLVVRPADPYNDEAVYKGSYVVKILIYNFTYTRNAKNVQIVK